MSDAVERVVEVLRETNGLFIEQSAEGWESDAQEVLAAAAPTVERVEALCRLLVDEGHMTAEGQRQVVALWGAL